MMKISLPIGKYVVAVSGGVDSMALLHLLMKQHHRLVNSQQSTVNSTKTDDSTNFQFVVAHFNHGIRPDSKKDEELVVKTAKKFGVPVEVGYGKLGKKASEEQARRARYTFLKAVQKEYKADGIITGHHQDDLIETAIINMIRGTGRRGMTAISRNPNIIRPLLNYPKAEIIKYAKKNNIDWCEDPTNLDTRYLRNYVRLEIMPRLSKAQRKQFLANLSKIKRQNELIDHEIATISQEVVNGKIINREKFIQLPHQIGQEVIMHWLRQNGIVSFDKKTVERLATAIKTARPGSKHEVLKDIKVTLNQKSAQVEV